MKVEEYHSFADIEFLKGQWDELVSQTSADPLGLDVTSTYYWAKALWLVNSAIGKLRIYVLSDQKQVVGIFPCFTKQESVFGLSRTSLHTVNSLYAGRQGFLIKGNFPVYFTHFLDFLESNEAHWERFLFTLPDEGPLHYTLEAVDGSHLSGRLRAFSQIASPCLHLPASQEDLYGRLNQKMRYNIRKTETRLRERGKPSLREITHRVELSAAFDTIGRIERRSWKHLAGTSIVGNPQQEAFYRAISGDAADQGWLHVFILYLDDSPIAYMYGLLYDGIFYDLKESYDESFKDFGPGQALKWMLVTKLVDYGVRYCDFMGGCEPHKMTWGPRVYTQTSYVCYRRGFKGEVFFCGERFRKYVRQRTSLHDGDA